MFDNYISSQMNFVSDKRIVGSGKARRFLLNLIPHLPTNKTSKVIEIGPGRGEMIETLRDLGYKNLIGLDISLEVVEFCNENLNEKCVELIDSLTAYFRNQEACSIDAVISSHVLEHIPKSEIIDLLENIRKSLSDNGCVISEIPNGDAPMSNIIFNGDFTHEVSYTERSLRQIFTVAGFTKVQIYPSLLPNDHLLRPLQKLLTEIIFFTIRSFCKILDIYQPNYLHGSIVCVARK